MKRILLLFLLVLLPICLVAVDLGASLHLSNLNLSPERSKVDTEISGIDYLYGISVFGSAQVSDDMNIEGGVYYDPILRYSIYSLINYRHDFFQLKAGPFFGVLNDYNTILKPGISTEIRIDLPGIVFTRLRADSSIGGRIVRTGDYLQEKSFIGVGFYVPNAICEVSLENKSYTEKTSAGEKVNELRQYAFSTNIYQKNRPYRINLTFAYQTRTLSYIETVTTEHILNSLVIGTRLDLISSETLDIFFDLESNVYSFGEADGTFIDLPDSGPGIYLFTLTTGFSLSLD